MVLRRVDAAAVGRAHHHRAGQASARPVPQRPGVVQQLVDRRVHEAHELELDHRPETLGAQAHRKTGEEGFRERRVQHAVCAETLQQPVGRPEDAAVDADVLAQDQDRLVVGHGPLQGQPDALDQRELRHRRPPPRARPRCAARSSGSSA